MISKTKMTPHERVFGSIVLPVRPAMAANGASLTLVEEVQQKPAEEAFFGGYAEDMLADIGMEAVDEQPQAAALKTRQV